MKTDRQASSPVQEYSPANVDDDKLAPVMQSQEQQGDRESSSEDIPLRQRRPVRASTHGSESSYDLHGRCQLEDHMREINSTSVLAQRRAAHQITFRKSPKATAKSTGKTPKKPGPRPWASKPIKKNDMKAKKEVIREIEKYWGKGFIKTYVPKCHRPLIKRGKGGKGTIYRDHETDPKKWLPSVLKSILSIAKLTQNKEWLKKAMNDVVRYRIKNTGNRKPQLVTTDFDILEDMLVKDWDVPYSFSIRYKHLLVNRQGQQESDEDIDHILGVGSGREDISDDEGDDVEVGDMYDQDEDDVDHEDDSEEQNQSGLTGRYLHTSGYTSARQCPQPHRMPIPPPQKHDVEPEISSKRRLERPLRPQPPLRNMKEQQSYNHPYPYSLPRDPWGRLIPYGAGPDGFDGYGRYGVYGGYGGHGSPPGSNGPQLSQALGYYNMGQYPPHHSMIPAPSQPDTDRIHRKRSQDSSTGGDHRMRSNFKQPPVYTNRPGFQPYGLPQNSSGDQFEVMQDTPEFEMHRKRGDTSFDKVKGPVDDIGEDSDAAALEAELRATELELKVARLQAKRAAVNQQSEGK